jgi:glycoside hydrolase-like protein
MLRIRMPRWRRVLWGLTGATLVAAIGLPATADGATAVRAALTAGRERAAAGRRAVTARPAAGRPLQARQMKVVSYRGYRFDIPRSWPVIKASAGSQMCVRFNMHVVYLGIPGVNQDCPSWLVGATEALLIEPGPARSPRRSVENPVGNAISASAPRIAITATFDTDPSLIYQILSSAGLAAPVIMSVNPARLADALNPAGALDPIASLGQGIPAVVSASQAAAEAAVSLRTSAPVLPSTVANRVGLGFDVCGAPSLKFMRAWHRRSPYRAIGIYIGGSDRACDQRNLTSRWVRLQAAAGWRFLPMYVGPQASFGQLKSPTRQGVSAAADAVLQAERLGFGPLTPVYYDMEAYPAKDARRALEFLSAWTRELRRLGYVSGVYSSSGSGITDLARAYRSHRYAMPDVIYDALWNGSKNVADRAYRRGEWAGRRRVHQFSGNVLQTFGGDTMDVDQDYLDLALAAPGGTTQGSPAAIESDGVACAFYEGTDHRLWEETRSRSGRWKRFDLGGDLSSGPTVVQISRNNLMVLYRSRSDHLTVVRRIGGRWQRSRQLYQFRIIGGAPHAVAQANGVIDVFWSGHFDRHLWHGEFSPGTGWTGPQRLGGTLGSAPSPVETSSGVVEVFWEGTDHRLWRVVREVGQGWTRPQDLGMWPMGGAPHAVPRPSGQVDVFWRGSTRPHHVWVAYVLTHRVRGPYDLGGRLVGQPWPVYASGTERVFYLGPRGQLWVLRRFGRRWGRTARAAKIRRVTAAPFAASGRAGAPLELFWRGAGDMLWSMRYAPPHGWQHARNLGGRVA